ncbi:MAG TPA: DNA repair protein RecO [Bacteroidia bacterium]|nr:DNA repair protein RecO [Bacteroidia bacterium]HNT80056.1 DNA repair protein RecO [Bacteroidia bacterium]
MLNKGRAIVLHCTEFGESSLIAKLFTESNGLKSFIVHGARSNKKKNLGFLLNPLSIVEYSAYTKSSALGKIKEINGSPLYHQIPFDIAKSSIALFLSEIIYKSVKEDDAHTELYHFLENTLQWLDHCETSVANFHLWIMLRMSKYLGFYPSGKFTDATPIFNSETGSFGDQMPSHKIFVKDDEAKAMYQLMTCELEQLYQVQLTHDCKKNLLDFLVEYFQLHCHSNTVLKSHKILHEVLNS